MQDLRFLWQLKLVLCVFWVITLCFLIGRYHCFGAINYHLSAGLKVEVECCSQNIGAHIPDYNIVSGCRREQYGFLCSLENCERFFLRKVNKISSFVHKDIKTKSNFAYAKIFIQL
jgi:hypothetical protein